MVQVKSVNCLWQRYVWFACTSLALLSSLPSCAPERETNLPDDQIWESEHFRYHLRESDVGVCKEVLVQLERHFDVMQTYLGFDWPANSKVEYYKFLDEQDYLANAGCPADSGGCTLGSTIKSYRTLQEHELIHAYLAPLGYPPRALVEGIAMILACDAPIATEVGAWEDSLTLAPSTNNAGAFAPAQWFVGNLLDKFEPKQFISLYDGLNDEHASATDIASAFEAEYHQAIGQIWDESAAASRRMRCVNLWPCQGATLPLDGHLVTIAQACDGSDNARTFEVTADSNIVLSSDEYSFFAPVRCGQSLPDVVGGTTDHAATSGFVYSPAIMSVPFGKYFITSFAGSPNTVRARRLVTTAISMDCTQSAPIALDAGEFTRTDFEVSVPSDGQAWYVKFQPPVGGHVSWRRPANNTDVEFCGSCDSIVPCKALSGGEDLATDSDGNVTVRITTKVVGSGNATYQFLLK